MPFDWPDYLVLAQELAQRTDEACLRSAISRAYYAVYCAARNHARQEGQHVPVGEGGHERLWALYRGASGRPFAAVGINGDRLRRRRTKADYEDQYRADEGSLPRDAHSAVQTAAATLRSISALGRWPTPGGRQH